MKRAHVAWFGGFTALALAVGVCGYVFHAAAGARVEWAKKVAASRTQGTKTPVSPIGAAPSSTLSRAACKPAWRRSVETVRAFARRPGEGDAVTEARALDTLIAVSDGAWGSATATGALHASRYAVCAPDDRGAWATVLRVPSDTAAKERCGDVVVEIARFDSRGEMVSAPAPMLLPNAACHTDANALLSRVEYLSLATVPDMNNDGVPEALLSYDGAAEYEADTHTLFTSRGGAVVLYPGTAGVPIADVHDENNDGRPDVLFHYTIDGGYEAGCGARRPELSSGRWPCGPRTKRERSSAVRASAPSMWRPRMPRASPWPRGRPPPGTSARPRTLRPKVTGTKPSPRATHASCR